MKESSTAIVYFCASLFLLMLVSCANAHFPANESTYLNFHIPTNLRLNASWPHVSSMFGRLGHGPEGRLVLPVKFLSKNRKLCNSNLDQMEVIKELHIPEDSGAPFMLLVERGDCTFVRKVRNAQQLGAAAVLIGDTENNFIQNHTNMDERLRLPDDGSGHDISIPSVMISKNEYHAIHQIINNKKNFTGVVVSEIAWHTPKFDNKVEMDLWYSPIDTHTKEFIASNFSSIARAFDLNDKSDESTWDNKLNLLRFKERPVLLDGKALGCIGNEDAPDEPCYKLCTNGGRYCHVSHRHTDGKDIVVEALRRLCITKHYKHPKVYWDYIDQFSNLCWDSDYFANEKCVKDAYLHSNIDNTIIDACIADSGSPEKDEENTLLQHSLDMQMYHGIHQSPFVTINHDVSQMVSWNGLNNEAVLRALCETFSYGEKPHVCYACMRCGDPVACAQRSPMTCLSDDGVEKEDPNAHKQGNHDSNNDGKKHRHSHWGRWIFGLMLIGGTSGGAYVYYKKQMELNGAGSGLGSYSLQDAFLSEST